MQNIFGYNTNFIVTKLDLTFCKSIPLVLSLEYPQGIYDLLIFNFQLNKSKLNEKNKSSRLNQRDVSSRLWDPLGYGSSRLWEL